MFVEQVSSCHTARSTTDDRNSHRLPPNCRSDVNRRKKEEGRRKKEEGRGKKEKE
ncbi:MAG: hypothetical protein HC894_23530, partial [Microcoleus sp. SM1_3_4]|nr:hypothetical protein [Microcoleus sp. SM1_3_4]